MYLRHSTRRKGGKTHTYWRLVRSVRCGGKVVQETVANLGELDAQGRAKAKALAREITGRPGQQRDFFEADAKMDATVAVRLGLSRAFAAGAGPACCWLMADGFFSLANPS